MATDYTAELLGVKVIPSQDSFTNIVKKVEWEVTFFDTDDEENVWSTGRVDSVLDTTSLDSSSFVSWDSITQQQILQFALNKEGGTDFLDSLLSGGHSAILAEKKENLALESKDIQLLALS